MSYLPSAWQMPDDGTATPDLFPLLTGQAFPTRSPMWSTSLATSSSGRERRQQRWSYPRWSFKLSYEVLRDTVTANELRSLWAFFNLQSGRYGSFFYRDPSEPDLANVNLGNADGVRSEFQIRRVSLYGGDSTTEPVRGVLGVPTVYIGTSPTTSFTIGAYGALIFSSPPPSGARIGFSGKALHLVRFDQDQLDATQMMTALWSASGLNLISLKA